MMPTAVDTTRFSHAAPAGRTWVGVVMVALVMAFVGAPTFADTVRLHDQMGVSEAAVELRQVAELTGERAEAVGDTVVGRFEGRDRIVITLEDVRRALHEREVHWGLLTLRGHRRCEVVRLEPRAEGAGADDGGEAADTEAGRPVAASNIEGSVSAGEEPRLRRRIENVIAELAGVPREDLRIAFRAQDERRLDGLTWTGRFEVEPGAATALGRVPLTVRQYRGGRAVETFALTADVERRVEALVARRRLSRGDRFDEDAVVVREVWVDDAREPLADPGMVRGQQAASTVRRDAVVYPDDVRAPRLIRRGELVTVRALSGGLVVRTVARAAEAGAMDEMIRMRNEGSRETFHARVTGRREAVVVLESEGASQQGASEAEGVKTIEMSLDPADQAGDGDE